MAQVCFGALVPKFKSFRMAIYTREKYPSFFDLQLMFLVEDNNTVSRRFARACATRATIGVLDWGERPSR